MDEIFTMPEVAKLLKVTPKTVYSCSPNGRLPDFKIGRQRRYKRAAHDEWIEEQKTAMKEAAQ
jgi:excisionase family DNA binding protein